MKNLTLYLLLVIFSYSCVSTSKVKYKVDSRYDEFEGYTVDSMYDNILGGKDIWSLNYVALNAQKTTTKENNIIFNLIVRYISNKWIFITKGESLVLLIDGNRYEFKCNTNSRDIVSGGIILESALYSVDKNILMKIAFSNEIKVRIYGSKYYKDTFFTQQNINNFKKFVTDYVL